MKAQQTNPCWDDIVFENRNKTYGAYAIRQDYPINVLRALLLCGGAVAGVFLLPSRSSVKEFTKIIEPDLAILISNSNIKVEERQKEIVPIKKTTSALLPTRVTTRDVPDVEPEDIIIENPSSIGAIEGTPVQISTGSGSSVDPIDDAHVETPPFVVAAEVMPMYEGGIPEMIKFIQRKLRYPTYAARVGITGTVYVSFVVSITGRITNIEIVKGIDKGCDEEAMRVIALMDRWKPGMQNKMPVAVRMVLPIKFVAGE